MADQVVEAQLKKLVDAWRGILLRAEEEKRAFNVIANQCHSFYNPKGGVGFMWEEKFKKANLGPNITNPKFHVTIAKAFEYVAIIGPMLYWQYPFRKVASYKPIEIDPMLLAGEDPQKQQLVQYLAEQQAVSDGKSKIRNELYQTLLNYMQVEQPGGGLSQHSELAISESLVKGRGCLWTENYKYPGSGRNLVGSFFDSVNNLIIDPDCIDPTLTKCKWIARKRLTPYWELEERFGLRKNYLRDKCNFESGTSQGKANSKGSRRSSSTVDSSKDLVEWFEVYTRCGVGSRIDGVRTSMDDAWDEVVGDYAYIAIAKGVEFPLNAPPLRLIDSSDEEVAEMFEWPCGPLWADDKWPVSCLDYYHDPESSWPIAPLAAGLGELICLNILVACYISQAYDNRQQIVAYLASAASSVEAALKSGDSPAFVKINDNVQKSINDIVQYLNRPASNNDLIDAIQFVIRLFEERTGLSELMYGRNPGGTNPRSAAEVTAKNDRIQVRPDYMAKKVAAWQSDVARKEMIVSRFKVTADDIAPRLGPLGAFAWNELVENEDPEVVIRGMTCTVEASDVRKPDKSKDTANLQSLLQTTMPVLAQYGASTGNYEPLNNFLASLGDSMEQDVSEWRIPAPQPNPEQQQIQALQNEELAAKADKLRADAESSRANAQQLQLNFEGEQAASQQKLQVDAAMAQQKMQVESLSAQQKLALAQTQARQAMQMDAAKTGQELQVNAIKSQQQIQLAEEQAQQKRQQDAVMFWQRLQQKQAMEGFKNQGGSE